MRATLSVILVVFSSLALVPLAAVQAVPVPAANDSTLLPQTSPQSESPGEDALAPVNVGAVHLANMMRHPDDERAVKLAVWAQLEQQGLLPMGSVPTAGRGGGPGPPETVLRDFHSVCDLDQDGYTDIVTNDLDFFSASSTLRALSGEDGTQLWKHKNMFYFDLPWYDRGGQPWPDFPNDFAPTIDVNADGVCDMLAYSMEATGFGVPLVIGQVSVADFEIHLKLLSGRDGKSIWDKESHATVVFAFAQDPLGAEVVTALAVLDFPTGFLSFFSPSGPKFVWKTTDIYRETWQDFRISGGALFAQDMYVSEHVFLRDAGDARVLWRRDINFTTSSEATNITWITGVADLAGNEEPEVVLDQYWTTNPQGTELDYPIVGKPLYRFGQGMSLMALRGEDGATHWQTLIHKDLPIQANTDSEENFEVLQWTHAQIIGDVTGDGRSEVVALFETEEQMMDTTINGAFKLHVAPVNGATGKRLWNEDFKKQGWGFVADLNPPGQSVPLIAVGVIDRPTLPPPGARFPPKDVRIHVLRVQDGLDQWYYSEKIAQDSYLPYHLTLHQYRESLAPFDWNLDGVKDVITPSRYVRPVGANQSLLSTAKHQYQILSGADGALLHEAKAWGGTGYVVNCGTYGSNLTVVSGHGRRLDATRIDPATNQVVWRRPVWNDYKPHAATRGVSLLALHMACDDTPDGRTMFGGNAVLLSLSRGFEVMPMAGHVLDNGTMQWQTPNLQGQPPLDPSFDLLADTLEHRDPTETLALNLTPAALGTIAGLGLGLVRRRARKTEVEVVLE